MLTMFGGGILIGIILVIASLRMTMREEPTGCIFFFGAIIFLIFSTLLAIPAVVLAG